MPPPAVTRFGRLFRRGAEIVPTDPAALRIVFSFIVDRDPKFAWQGWHLARSLMRHCAAEPAAVHVQFTPDVPAATRALFADLGCTPHEIQRFGDGRWCNKIGQLDALLTLDFSHAVLLDTDMIAVGDIRPMLDATRLMAKPVDFANPPLPVLTEIARAAGMETGRAKTFLGNCNGGFYSVPKPLAPIVAAAWRHWAKFLLEHNEPLKRVGQELHTDQVAMWLAIRMERIPHLPAPSNLNYFIHFAGRHRYFDRRWDLALIHYHDASMSPLGRLDPPARLRRRERRAVAEANRQIGEGFENRSFWDLRYARFAERGSGLGSRGENLAYKRALLRAQGVEAAESVLDFGCGDLEVVKALDLQDYLGLDGSPAALDLARAARPDWHFLHFTLGKTEATIPRKALVLCFEVLIHQPSATEYRAVIDFLAAHTEATLIVSGYDEDTELRRRNPMVFFWEPLETSLGATSKFRSIRRIGAHSDVTVWRCDV
jgi:hypothetical protein